MTGNAAAGAPKSASPAGCARSAEESPSLPNAACAIPAGRSGGRPNAPGTPRARPKAGSTAAGIPRSAEGSGGREAGGASVHTGTSASARVAATVPRSRAARPAGLAVTHGKRPNGSSMPPGGPMVGVVAAAGRPLTAPRAAVPAPPSRPGAIHGRTPPAEGATSTGERAGFVRLWCSIAESGAVRAVRAPVLGALGRASGPSDPSAALHRDRDRHGRGPRDLGQLGGGGHVPGLRPVVPRSGGDR